MPNRILKESICTSEEIDSLTPEEELLFYRLLVQCDDFGRFDARPSIVKARCFPLRLEEIKEKQVIKWLTSLCRVGLIKLYTANNKQYLLVTTWEKHQQVRAKRSKYPEPEVYCNQLIADDSKLLQAQSEPVAKSVDSKGNQLIADDSICPRNPIQSNPNPIRESNPSETSVSDEPLRLSNLLKDLMLTNDPGAKFPADLKKWAAEIDQINRLDGRSFEVIEAVINHSQQDKFWKTNILSAGKLRDKFSTIYLQMQNNGGQKYERIHGQMAARNKKPTGVKIIE